MKVAIVHDWLTGMRGGERVLEIFCRLFPDADIYTLFYFPEKISGQIKKHTVIPSRLQHVPGIRKHYRMLLPLFPSAVESFDLTGYDLVISSSHAVAKGAMGGDGSVSVCYCHTPMRYIWAMFDTYFGRNQSPRLLRLAAHLVRPYLASWDRTTTRRVGHFLANSRFIARQIESVYGRAATVIHPPVDTDLFVPAGCAPREDYYLIVSALAPYKRIDLAVEAFNRIGKRLVIIGSGTELQGLRAVSGETIEFKGYLRDDRDVVRYYQNCRALLFPGVEDFGLTPLEAQACGRPVIAFAGGGVLESVIEGVSGHFFHEQTVDALTEAVYEFEKMTFDPAILRRRALYYSAERMTDRLKTFFLNIPEINNIRFEEIPE
ncbi:glycosyltransferase [bacterium]|nr:glycosyltransferase [candidate division CSSED10-310 bacterium]